MKYDYLTWRERERDRDYRIIYTVDHVADNRPITFDVTTYICVAVWMKPSHVMATSWQTVSEE